MYPRVLSWDEFLSRSSELRGCELVIKEGGKEYEATIERAELGGEQNDKVLAYCQLEDVPDWVVKEPVEAFVFNQETASTPYEYEDGRIVFVNAAREVAIHPPHPLAVARDTASGRCIRYIMNLKY